MTNESLIRRTVRDAEVIFMIGAEDDEETADNADAIIVLADRSRWSVTFLTLDAIAAIMTRHAESGESRSGAYLRVPDLVIPAKPGLASMMLAVADLIDQGLDGLLPRLEPGEHDEGQQGPVWRGPGLVRVSQ
jgi:hypothetical protein